MTEVDEVRIGRAAAGDADAFSALLQTRLPSLVRIADLILRDGDRADDAVQRALVSAWRRLPQLRDPARFDNWLRALVTRAALDESRRRARWSRLVHRSSELPSRRDDDLEQYLERDRMTRALGQLTPVHRAVLVLRYYAGMTAGEIAEAMGIGEATVRSRVRLALQALRAAVDSSDREK